MRLVPLFLVPVLALSLMAPCVAAQSTQLGDPIEATKDETTRKRLAATFVRYAREVIGTEPLSVQSIKSALDFLVDATRLDPDSRLAWRLLSDLARVGEEFELANRAIREVLRLEPDNSEARLDRLLLVLDTTHRLEEQDAMIRQLLEPGNIEVIGMDVASRLALRLAILDRRAGDLEGFQRWLWESVRLDPTNVEAKAMQSGLVEHLADSNPPAWTGVLLGLLEANLADSAVASELGLYLLDHGAYVEAARMLRMSSELEVAAGRDPGSDLDADIVLALWAAGKDDAALAIITERQKQVDELYREITRSQQADSGVSREEVLETARLRAPVPPKLAMIRAMVMSEHGDRSELEDALGDAVLATDHLDQIREEAGAPPAVRAANLRRLLWVLVMLKASPGAIEDTAHRIDQLTPMSEPEKRLIAIGQGFAEVDAESQLQDNLKVSPVAGVLFGDMLARQGRLRDAAELLLGVWRQAPGSIVGIYAAHRLENLLGDSLPEGEPAASMSRITRTLSSTIDRLPLEPTLGTSIRVEPRATRVAPYDPILIDVEITNHLHRPVGIHAAGPIRDLVLIMAEVEFPNRDAVGDIPFLVDVARRLRLGGNESIEFTIDLRETWVGSVVDATPLWGASIDIEAILNPRVATAPTSRQPTQLPGPLGSEARSDAVRVDGVRVTNEWASGVVDRLLHRQGSRELVDWALLSHAIVTRDSVDAPSTLSDELMVESVAAMAEAWPALDGIAQAWITSTLASGDRLTELWSMIGTTADPVVERVHLMRVLKAAGSPGQALDDPIVVAGLRSENPTVRHLAEWIEASLQIQAEELYGKGSEAISEQP